MRQWLRKVRVTFDGGFTVNPGRLRTHELRVEFRVFKTISGSPNEFEVKIWNLREGHRNALGRELSTITLEAGYEPPEGGTNVGVIAQGNIRDFQHDRVGPDIITTLSSGDGDLAYRRATVSKTIPKGTPIQDVVEELYRELEEQGITRGEWRFPEGMRTLRRPYSMSGGVVRELNLLGRSNRFYWSIQNGAMEVIPGDGYLPGVIRVGPQSGMVGTPTITDNGIKVEALLNPDARPNRLVEVQSDILAFNQLSSQYRISNLDFIGGNTEGPFNMIIHGEAVADGAVDEGTR